jgi:hypothetical protein
MKPFTAHRNGPSARKAPGAFICLLWSAIALAPLAAQPGIPSILPGPDESLRWEIRYGAIPIASAVLSGRGEGGAFVLDLASDPSLPMAKLRNIYEFMIDPITMDPIACTNSSSWGLDRKRIAYAYDREAGNILYEGDFTEKGVSVRKSGSIAIDENVLDGLALILRMMSRAGKAGSERAAFIGEATAIPIDLIYGETIESISMRGSAGSVPAYRIDGLLSGKGVAGLSGAFTVWVRAETPKIPVKASLKVWLGSVTVEFAPKPAALAAASE